ncbi:MAG: hypothetical protein R2731_06320 [Nocardioides sp.]
MGDRRLPLGAAHGDWAPWNMAWSGDVLEVWDWERSTPTSLRASTRSTSPPPGCGRPATPTTPTRPSDASSPSCQVLLAGCGVDPALTRILLALDLLHAGRRYAADLDLVPVPAVEARLAWVLRLLTGQTDLIERGVLA